MPMAESLAGISRHREALALLDAALTAPSQTGECWREAEMLLRKSYGWFSEGFETVDLQEARAFHTRLTAV